jgi:hypothetical protein
MKPAMVWVIDLTNGKKLAIIKQLMSIKGSLVKSLLHPTNRFPINTNMRYEMVIDWVRKLADQVWWDSDYKGIHKKHTSLFTRVKSNCNWAHHTDNDPRWPMYKATDSKQQQLVDDLRELLSHLGVLSQDQDAAADDAADFLSSAMQRMHV